MRWSRAVSAASGDRTFIVETVKLGNAPYAFYLFHLSPSGLPGALSRVPVSVPGGETTEGFALSPDADKLAVALVSGGSGQEFGIAVHTLATGAVRIWTADSPGAVTILEAESTMSWTQDERTLSFPWGAGRWVCSGTPVLTPDGKTLACGAVSSAHSVANDQVAGIAEYDAAHGMLERVLGRHQSSSAGALLWWENTSGSVLIGSIRGPFDSCPTALPPTIGVFTGNRFVALPGMPERFIGSFAW